MALPGSLPIKPPKVVNSPPPAKKPIAAKNTPAKRKALAAAAAPGGGGAAAPVNKYQAQAQAQIDPIIAAITSAAHQGAQAADQQIQGLTNSYAQGISGINYGAPYAGGEAQQAAVDSALQQSATGQGSDLAAALSQRLQALQGSSGAGAVNQEANALASQGSGIGGAQLATGSAALNQLISDAAAAQSYGQKMPGVIDTAGLQGIQQAQGQAQTAINQGTLQAESQLPSIEQTLRADKLQAQANAQTKAYRNAEIALSGQRNSIAAQRAAVSAQQGNARIAQGNARIQIEAQRAAQTAAHENATTKIAWDRLGIENQRLQLSIMKQSATSKMGGLTPAEQSRYHALASSWAQRMTGPSTNPTEMVKGPNGNLVPKQMPQLSFKDAMTEALKAGVPLDIAFPTFIKVAKQNGATPIQIRQLQKEYAPLDKALKSAIASTPQYTPGGGPGLGSVAAGAGSAKNLGAAKAYAYSQLGRYGWNSPSQAAALDKLWERESGWNPAAKNPSSGALGIPQELGHNVPAGYANNPRIQIHWGLDYIKQRYGSPAAAWDHEMKFGWY